MRGSTTANCFGCLTASAIIHGGLRFRLAQFKLCAHFLELRLHLSDGPLEILTLLRNRRLQFLYFAVFFEKFIEQHCVHCFVANGVNLALGVLDDQIGIHPFHVLGYEAKLRSPISIDFLLVTECDRASARESLRSLYPSA